MKPAKPKPDVETFGQCTFCSKHHGVTLRDTGNGNVWAQVPAGTWIRVGAVGMGDVPPVRCSGCLGRRR